MAWFEILEEVPVHESKVINLQSGIEPQANFEDAKVDHTEAWKVSDMAMPGPRPGPVKIRIT